MYLKKVAMSRRFSLLAGILCILIIGCNTKESYEIQVPSQTTIEDVGTVHTGSIVVKMKEEIAQTKSISDALSELEIYSIEKLFPTDPRFEERHRAAGLHLWYHITFNPNVSLTKAAQDFSVLEGVEIVEYMPVIRPAQDNALSNPFNDPFFSYQWHYHNTAPKDGYVMGADINLLKAWSLETGDPSVIVAVIDAGVDYRHEDLADAMWVNEKELNGTVGVDDDNNGYNDDIYGYNFAVGADGSSMQGAIKPEDHGTHVAGTVAAVNNNGKYGAGIAGGNGSEPGARIMTCQTISGNSPAYIQRAFVYAADNGAVISQNSWSLLDATSTPEYLIEAIEYFKDNAGIDEHGNQIGPMKGGVVIFAAGNENATTAYPSMYDGVITVAATGPSGAKSSYSNYGSWVDIAAPGGENGASPYGDVYSTIPNNQFGAMSGTSMACPHVSGVAALMVSKFGGPGYTNDMLWTKLLESADEEKLYSNEINSRYKGLLGVGALDAFAALYEDDGALPEPVTELAATAYSNQLKVEWSTSATNGESTYGYRIYYSTKDLSAFNPETQDDLVKTVVVLGGAVPLGEKLTYTVTDLEFQTDYFVRIQAFSASNKVSQLSNQVTAKTKDNIAPVITPGDDISVTLKPFESKVYKFVVKDPDSHSWDFDFKAGSSAAGVKKIGDTLEVSLDAYKADSGSYSAKLTVTDKYDGTASVSINYTIKPNTPPAVSAQIPNVLIQKGEEQTIDLSQYIKDDDGEALTYTATSSATSKIVDMTIDGSTLKLKGNWYGATTITVKGTDAKGASASASFDVLLRDSAVPLDIYPNPVQTTFNIRTANEVVAKVVVTNISGATVYSQADVAIDPFHPHTVDATTWGAGSYSVEVNVNGEITRRSIVKL